MRPIACRIASPGVAAASTATIGTDEGTDTGHLPPLVRRGRCRRRQKQVRSEITHGRAAQPPRRHNPTQVTPIGWVAQLINGDFFHTPTDIRHRQDHDHKQDHRRSWPWNSPGDQWPCIPTPARCNRSTNRTTAMIPNSTYRPQGTSCRAEVGRQPGDTSSCTRSP